MTSLPSSIELFATNIKDQPSLISHCPDSRHCYLLNRDEPWSILIPGAWKVPRTKCSSVILQPIDEKLSLNELTQSPTPLQSVTNSSKYDIDHPTRLVFNTNRALAQVTTHGTRHFARDNCDVYEYSNTAASARRSTTQGDDDIYAIMVKGEEIVLVHLNSVEGLTAIARTKVPDLLEDLDKNELWVDLLLLMRVKDQPVAFFLIGSRNSDIMKLYLVTLRDGRVKLLHKYILSGEKPLATACHMKDRGLLLISVLTHLGRIAAFKIVAADVDIAGNTSIVKPTWYGVVTGLNVYEEVERVVPKIYGTTGETILYYGDEKRLFFVDCARTHKVAFSTDNTYFSVPAMEIRLEDTKVVIAGVCESTHQDVFLLLREENKWFVEKYTFEPCETEGKEGDLRCSFGPALAIPTPFLLWPSIDSGPTMLSFDFSTDASCKKDLAVNSCAFAMSYSRRRTRGVSIQPSVHARLLETDNSGIFGSFRFAAPLIRDLISWNKTGPAAFGIEHYGNSFAENAVITAMLYGTLQWLLNQHDTDATEMVNSIRSKLIFCICKFASYFADSDHTLLADDLIIMRYQFITVLLSEAPPRNYHLMSNIDSSEQWIPGLVNIAEARKFRSLISALLRDGSVQTSDPSLQVHRSLLRLHFFLAFGPASCLDPHELLKEFQSFYDRSKSKDAPKLTQYQSSSTPQLFLQAWLAGCLRLCTGSSEVEKFVLKCAREQMKTTIVTEFPSDIGQQVYLQLAAEAKLAGIQVPCSSTSMRQYTKAEDVMWETLRAIVILSQDEKTYWHNLAGFFFTTLRNNRYATTCFFYTIYLASKSKSENLYQHLKQFHGEITDNAFKQAVAWKIKSIEEAAKQMGDDLIREAEQRAKAKREKKIVTRKSVPTKAKDVATTPVAGKTEVAAAEVTPKQETVTKVEVPLVPVPNIVMTIGRIRLTSRRLGIGSHGTNVLSGFYDNEECAVKVLSESHWPNVARELEIMNNLYRKSEGGYPSSLIRVFGSEEQADPITGKRLFIAMEKCDGTLSKFVGEKLFSTLESKLQALQDIANAVAFLHRADNNIVHNDLNPNNVLIKSGKCKVTDFGLSKQLDGINSFTFSHQLGTGDGFRAHEVLMSKPKTNKVDIFALGVLFYYILSDGKLPFGSATEPANTAISNCRKPDLFVLTPKQSHLVERMLSHNPADRPDMNYVLAHPMFWSNQKTLYILSQFSEELSGKTAEGAAKRAEAERFLCVNATLPWNRSKSADVFYKYLTSMRGYDEKLMVDLLRGIRNVYVHWADAKESAEITKLLNNNVENLVGFLESNYPLFVVQCWNAMGNKSAISFVTPQQ